MSDAAALPLNGMKIAISVSDAPDRRRLGFPDREIDRAIVSICTALIRSGARVVYGGDLRSDGFTFKIFHHLAGLYAGGESPFIHVIPQPVLFRQSLPALVAMLDERRGTAVTLACLDGDLMRLRADGDRILATVPAGPSVDLFADAAVRRPDRRTNGFRHTQVRKAVSKWVDGRISLGGKMGLLELPADRYEGEMPGILEEAILTLEAGKPLVALGAYGGATRDMAIALGLMPRSSSVPRGKQHESYGAAIKLVEEIAWRVPASLRPALTELACSDQTEYAANGAARLIKQWQGAKPTPDERQAIYD